MDQSLLVLVVGAVHFYLFVSFCLGMITSFVSCQRSKSKGLFEDEDILFGTPEENPPVDIFSKAKPAQVTKVSNAEYER